MCIVSPFSWNLLFPSILLCVSNSCEETSLDTIWMYSTNDDSIRNWCKEVFCVVIGLSFRTTLSINSDSVLPYSIHNICNIDRESIEKLFNELQESLLSLSLLRCKDYSIRFTVIHDRKDSIIVEFCNVLTAESRWTSFYRNEDTYKMKLQRKIFEFLIGFHVYIQTNIWFWGKNRIRWTYMKRILRKWNKCTFYSSKLIYYETWNIITSRNFRYIGQCVHLLIMNSRKSESFRYI